MYLLNLDGGLRTTAANRATLATCDLRLFTCPLVRCAQCMGGFSTLTGNLALLLWTHRCKTSTMTFLYLHYLFPFVRVSDLACFTKHTLQRPPTINTFLLLLRKGAFL